jgi:hypothetical protein
MTPNKMMLGREINLPSELIFKNVREELFKNEEQYVTSLRNNIQKIHEIARKTHETSDGIHQSAVVSFNLSIGRRSVRSSSGFVDMEKVTYRFK